MPGRRHAIAAAAGLRVGAPVVGRAMPLVALFCLLLLFAGCASSSGGDAPAKEAPNLDVKVSAALRVNLDTQGRPAPVQVRIYELRTAAAFEAADYFSLAGNDKAVLQADLLSRQDYLLRPGETRRLQRRAHADATAIGVLAGYREIDTRQWRAVQALPEAPEASWMRAVLPRGKARLSVTVDEAGVRIELVD
ncbi:MAG: type VI secretion system lipoprotein TssJ [Burkholderiales bacterium]|nr:type VI secretion system lipoprotein TssJ [Burkholderiales bacterium]